MPLAKDVHATTVATTVDASAYPEAVQPAGSERTQTSWASDAETHLIRLCLDLQLDAMLLALGAAASNTRGGAKQSPADTAAQTPPWRRWVLEDVEMVCTLAGDVVSGGASLPAMLGSDLDQAVPAAAIDTLMAHYESMAALLADILPAGGSRSPAPYRSHAQDALARCQERLRELRSTRLDHTPPRGLTLPAAADHPPVPGEWLG